MTSTPTEWQTRLLDVASPAKHVLVVGGGATAARRAATFARDGVAVTLIASSICDAVLDLLLERSVTWDKRALTAADLEAAWLIVPATGDPVADALVCRWVDRLRGRLNGGTDAAPLPRLAVG